MELKEITFKKDSEGESFPDQLTVVITIEEARV